MLGFLRRIRRSLIEDGHLKKYLVYATGEILLVMIGILLALQVNNWNESRKTAEEGHQILIGLKENSETNIRELQKVIELDRISLRSIDIVLENLIETKVYHDSLDHHFIMSESWSRDTWKNGSYETLRTKGMDLVQSDSLRSQIIYIYEARQQDLINAGGGLQSFVESNLYPQFIKHFQISDFAFETFDEKAKPVEYENLIHSQEYINVLSFWKLIRLFVLSVRVEVLNELTALNEHIDLEL